MSKIRGTYEITFANFFVGIGDNHGIINIQLGATLFTPDQEGEAMKIDPDPVVTVRLRLTEPCARLLHAALSEKLERMGLVRATPTEAPSQPEKLN